MGPSIKDVCSHGEGGLSSADILWTRGVLQMWTSTLFGTKRFFEIYGMSAQSRGIEPV